MLLGFDIGGSKCAVCIGDDEGRILDRRELETDPGATPESIVNSLVSSAKQIARHVNAIGISCGGPLDRETGVIYRPPNLPLWEAVPIRAIVEKAFPRTPVTVDNDANATALAEWRFGAGQGTRNMAFVTMGTGIGAGLILDGKLYHGTNDLAGEVGHQTILINGPLCGCGKRGCLESLASGPAIARLARESLLYGRGKRLLELAGRTDDITAKHVIDAAKEGDSFSIKILEEAGSYMGIGLANLIQILNPERIVLGTIAVHAGDVIMEPIRKAVEEYAWERSRKVCKIVPAALGDRAQDLAALCLAMAE